MLLLDDDVDEDDDDDEGLLEDLGEFLGLSIRRDSSSDVPPHEFDRFRIDANSRSRGMGC